MMYPPIAFLIIAAGLAVLGYRTEHGSGSADERLGSVIPYGLAALSAAVAVLWWVAVVTFKAFT